MRKYIRAAGLRSCLGTGLLALIGCGSSDPGRSPCTEILPSSVQPRMLQDSLGSYSSVGLNPTLGPALDGHVDNILAPANPVATTRGAVLEVARYGTIVYSHSAGALHGNPSLIPNGLPLTPNALMMTDAIFDLESMTKLTTATLIIRLAEFGYIKLSDPVTTYIPEFAQSYVYNMNHDGWVDADNDGMPDLVPDPAKVTVTVLDLLAYRGGLAIDVTSFDPIYGSTDPWITMARVPLDYTPRATQMYSDLSYRLLGHVAEVAMLAPLHELVRTYVTGPFGMTDSDYEPEIYMSGSAVSYKTGTGSHQVQTVNKLARVAGTGAGSAGMRAYVWAAVQDDNDYWTQRHNVIHKDKNGNTVELEIGTPEAPSGTGCDGMFATARDFMKLGQIYLNMGKRVDPLPPGATTQLLTSADVSAMTAVPVPTATFQPLIPSASHPVSTSFGQNLFHSHKGYGWELPDGGPSSPSGQGSTSNVVTKTGGAGTYIKLDFANDTIAILMTNHGLPDVSTIGVTSIGEQPYYMVDWPGYDAMLKETGPADVNDLVSSNTFCTTSM